MSSTIPRSARNPNLSIFDTGEVLEPKPGTDGTVDFDNDENATVLQVKASPSATTPNTTVLDITGFGPEFVEIIVAGKSVWFGDGETGEAVVR